ncbi:MerR family transcriptional regulator [Saccharopolyspora taberi]|uniref:MerR family transcriptional regulator n=1 Tax=Saccharopolyspora taberi TaxID=60895 RepID=UPI0031E31122
MTTPEPDHGQHDPTPIGDSGAILTPAGADDDQPRLTVAAVASRLGVAPATLRTWDRRYGLGPSDHTTGRHRRYGPDDIARLEQMQRALLRGASPAEAARYARSSSVALPQRDPAAPAESADDSEGPMLLSGVLDDAGAETARADVELRSTDGASARGLRRAALALDSWSMHQLLIESIESDGVVATWEDTFRPALWAITERRQRSGSGVEALQLLVDCATTAFRSVIATAPAPLNPRPVVLAPVPGEAQELELVALAAALAANRVGHRLFGAALPSEGLKAAVRRSAPAAVVLWAGQPNYASARVIGDLPPSRQRFRAFAAGAGWSGEALPAHVEILGSLEAAAARVSETVLG